MDKKLSRDAKYWIDRFQLETHPEGGYYRQIYKSNQIIPSSALSDEYNGERPSATSIYFLLPSGKVSHLHRLASDEVWYHHYGATLTIHTIDQSGDYEPISLGPETTNGGTFQALVSGGTIFGATVEEKDTYALVSCMVSPGFTFQDFELLDSTDLLRQYPQHEAIIKRLT
ncbi:MAG: cupin domain-containing protein [Cyclobacteriaceae bacterium]